MILKNHLGKRDIYASSGGLLLHDRLFIKPFTIINNLCCSLPLARRKFTNSTGTLVQNLLSLAHDEARKSRRERREKKRERKREKRESRGYVTNTYLSKPNDATDARNPAT